MKDKVENFDRKLEIYKKENSRLPGRCCSRRILSSLHPRLHLHNIHMSINNPESDSEPGRTDSTAKYREEVTLKQAVRVGTWSRSKQILRTVQERGVPQTCREQRKRPSPQAENPH